MSASVDKAIQKIEQWRDMVVEICKDRKVDPDLVMSIIEHESLGGDPFACRMEPNYRWTNNPRDFARNLGISYLTEFTFQSMGLGLMQIQGATIRDLGYLDHLSKCFDPHLNVWFGVSYLKKLLEKYGDEVKAISAYNAGHVSMINGMFSNQKYVDHVSGFLRKRRALK